MNGDITIFACAPYFKVGGPTLATPVMKIKPGDPKLQVDTGNLAVVWLDGNCSMTIEGPAEITVRQGQGPFCYMRVEPIAVPE